MEMDIFLNGYYKLIKLLYDNQTVVLNKTIIPLTQVEISKALGMSKVKVNSMFGELQKQGYLKQETRGKYRLTESIETIIKDIEALRKEIKQIEGR